jgi:hypothetical protein
VTLTVLKRVRACTQRDESGPPEPAEENRRHGERRRPIFVGAVAVAVGIVLSIVLPHRPVSRGLGPGVVGGGVAMMLAAAVENLDATRRRAVRLVATGGLFVLIASYIALVLITRRHSTGRAAGDIALLIVLLALIVSVVRMVRRA